MSFMIGRQILLNSGKQNLKLLAGCDLQGKGTWLGITTGGRYAAITNYRDPASWKNNAPSRGKIVSAYLTGKMGSEAYLKKNDATGP